VGYVLDLAAKNRTQRLLWPETGGVFSAERKGCKGAKALVLYILTTFIGCFSGAVFNAWACPPVKRFEEKKQSNRHSAALQCFSSYFSYRFSPCKMFLLF